MTGRGFDGVLLGEECFEGDVIATGQRDSRASGEVRMFQAVVARIWGDAFIAGNTWLQNSDRGCDPGVIRAEARRWLLLDFGGWKTDREEICISAGLDPEAVRRAALRRNELVEVEDQERNKREIENIDRCFKALVGREHTLTEREVGMALGVLVKRENAMY